MAKMVITVWDDGKLDYEVISAKKEKPETEAIKPTLNAPDEIKPESKVIPLEVEKIEDTRTKKQINARNRFKRFYAKRIQEEKTKKICECGKEVTYMYYYEHRKKPVHFKRMEELKRKEETEK